MSKIDNDHKELSSTWAATVAEGYKVVMACLLSVFVPQYCPDTQATCTFKQNFSDLTPYNIFVLFFNFWTLSLFLYLYYLQNKREAYLISHLDADRNHTVSSFATNLKEYPRIISRVNEQNNQLYKLTRLAMKMFSVNIVFSAVLVFHYYYDGFRTVTTLVANVLLVSSKLFNMDQVLKGCISDVPLALSTYRTAPVAYNVVDENYKGGKHHQATAVKEDEAIEVTPTIVADNKE